MASGRSQASACTPSLERAYRILHFGFTVAPILAGVDKFFNVLTDWSKYLPDVV